MMSDLLLVLAAASIAYALVTFGGVGLPLFWVAFLVGLVVGALLIALGPRPVPTEAIVRTVGAGFASGLVAVVSAGLAS